MAYIDGEIPPIDSKNVKIGDFAFCNRKISHYLPRNVLHSAFNRKISVKEKSSYVASLPHPAT